jgi:hypothetical protein
LVECRCTPCLKGETWATHSFVAGLQRSLKIRLRLGRTAGRFAPVGMTEVGGSGFSLCLERHMTADEEDFPVAYLVFAVAAMIGIGAVAIGAFVILIR